MPASAILLDHEPPAPPRRIGHDLADALVAGLAEALSDARLLAELAAIEVRETGRGKVLDRAARLAGIVGRIRARLAGLRALGDLAPVSSGVAEHARPLGVVDLELTISDGLGLALAALLVAAKTGNALRVAAERPLLPALERLGAVVDGLLLLASPLTKAADPPGPVMLVDAAADIAATASRLLAAKAQDNGTARHAPAAVLAVGGAGPALVEMLAAAGAWRLGPEATARAAVTLCREGVPNRTLIGRDARVLAIGLGLPPAAATARLLLAEPEGEPLAGPWLRLPGSLVLAVWRVEGWDAAVAALVRAAGRTGRLASLALDGVDPDRARGLAAAVDVDRVVCGAIDDPILAELEPGGRLDWRRLVRITRVRVAPAG